MGSPIEGAIHESLRLFGLCENTNWTHLPVSGGIYDQHPKFLEDMQVLFGIKGKIEARKQAEQERRMKQQSSRRGPTR